MTIRRGRQSSPFVADGNHFAGCLKGNEGVGSTCRRCRNSQSFGTGNSIHRNANPVRCLTVSNPSMAPCCRIASGFDSRACACALVCGSCRDHCHGNVPSFILGADTCAMTFSSPLAAPPHQCRRSTLAHSLAKVDLSSGLPGGPCVSAPKCAVSGLAWSRMVLSCSWPRFRCFRAVLLVLARSGCLGHEPSIADWPILGAGPCGSPLARSALHPFQACCGASPRTSRPVRAL